MTDKPTKGVGGAAANVVALADAARDLARQKRRRLDPPPAEPRAGAPAGKWTANNLGLPKEDPCPVTPLGVEGEYFHLTDSFGQFRSLAARDFSHAGMQGLFAACPHWPQWAWPRYGRAPSAKEGEAPKPPPIKSFDDDTARQALMLSCGRRGLFSPDEKLRGRGMWLTKGGGLIYHAGEELWTFDAGRERPVVQETGLHEGFFYPRFPPLPSPWTEKVGADNPARELLTAFRLWNWARPEVDPILLLGWIVVAYLGGALDWRSAVLLIGDAGTGKSSLQDGLKDLFGEALFHSADTSAAGIYQRMKSDTRPIALDEMEPDYDGRNKGKVDAVVRLMRDASSGAIGRRGGGDGVASQFQMRSAFLFSAINNPLHSAQDLSRVAALRLWPLKEGQTQAPAIDADTCGRRVLAIVMREWHRFEETRAEYMRALASAGHSARGQKTYGTLIAAADLLLGADMAAELDVPLTEDLAWWSERLSADALPEIEDAMPNWRKCVAAILTNQVEVWRGGKRATVAQCIADLEEGERGGAEEHHYGRAEAMRDLGATGLSVVHAEILIDRLARAEGIAFRAAADALGLNVDDGWLLAVPPGHHPAVRRLLRETEWANGSWRDALRQCPVPGIMLTDKRINRVMIGAHQERCTLVVLKRYKEAVER